MYIRGRGAKIASATYYHYIVDIFLIIRVDISMLEISNSFEVDEKITSYPPCFTCCFSKKKLILGTYWVSIEADGRWCNYLHVGCKQFRSKMVVQREINFHVQFELIGDRWLMSILDFRLPWKPAKPIPWPVPASDNPLMRKWN